MRKVQGIFIIFNLQTFFFFLGHVKGPVLFNIESQIYFYWLIVFYFML